MSQDEDAKELARRAHLAGLYKAIFEDDKRGETILLDLQARFVRAPNSRDFTPEGVQRVFVQAHVREVIEYIVRQINKAHGVSDITPPEGSDHEPA